MCPRCRGYMVRDKGYEFEVQVALAYRCVNCGYVVDKVIYYNSQPKAHYSIPVQEKQAHRGRRVRV